MIGVEMLQGLIATGLHLKKLGLEAATTFSGKVQIDRR